MTEDEPQGETIEETTAPEVTTEKPSAEEQIPDEQAPAPKYETVVHSITVTQPATETEMKD